MGLAFSDCQLPEDFYFVSLAFKCDVNKNTSTPKDLRIMGDICNLEYELLANIRELTDTKLPLNKK